MRKELVMALLALALTAAVLSGAGIWLVLTDPVRAVLVLSQDDLAAVAAALLDLVPDPFP